MAFYIVATPIFLNGSEIPYTDIQFLQSFGNENEVIGAAIRIVRKNYVSKMIGIPEVQEVQESEILQLLEANGYTFSQNKIVYNFDRNAAKQLIIDNIEIGREKKLGIIKPLKQLARLLDIDVEDQ